MGRSLEFFQNNGLIDSKVHCDKCGYECCKTEGDNFIVLFPWERVEAARVGLKLEHLETIDDNPALTHCIRPCLGDDDYKPGNCAIYPTYPISEDLSDWVRGSKNRCPISSTRLSKQIGIVKNALVKIEKAHPGSIKILVDSIKEYPGALEQFK